MDAVDTTATASGGGARDDGASSRIVRLPDYIIDQIAAGEVIERPASVVKELVENALDADATAISIDCAGGGIARISVADDGGGMSAAEAHLALMRHATSKLRTTDDLLGLATHGFRGEALPSIASVSRLTLTTRRPGDLGGVQLRVQGGASVGERAAGCAVGTTIEVCDLLFNQPARRKFLKSTATELSHISDWVLRLALAHPNVGFVLRHEGREVLDLSAASQRDRVIAGLGVRFAPFLREVVSEIDGIRIRAYLVDASQAQLSARGLHVFVGRRWVRDRGLAHAVAMAYGETLPKGRHPLGAVFVDVPPGSGDINVHPQKLEVRFSDASLVYAAVRRAIRPILDEPFAPLAGVDFGHAGRGSGAAAAASSVRLSSSIAHRYVVGRGRATESPAPPPAAAATQTLLPLGPAAPAVRPAPPVPTPVSSLRSPRAGLAAGSTGASVVRPARATARALPWARLAATFVPHAVYWSRFALGACEVGLVAIDVRGAVVAAVSAGEWPEELPAAEAGGSPSQQLTAIVDRLLAPLALSTLPFVLAACATHVDAHVRVLGADDLARLISEGVP